jgi:hypothetical protein
VPPMPRIWVSSLLIHCQVTEHILSASPMSSPVPPRVAPLNFRYRSLSSSDTMPPFDPYNRTDSSSPVCSSPLPPTPVASSSPPGYPRIQSSPGYLLRGDISQLNDDYDDISTVWGRAYQGRGGPLKRTYAPIPAPFPLRSDSEPSWTSKSDVSGFDQHTILDDTDEEDEYETFGDARRQTCFATSSERGRWKSSPIPIKTHSRSVESASSRPNEKVVNVNTADASNSRAHTEWRRHSTASPIPDTPESPIVPTLLSRSEEPLSRHQTSSPLPPSSPPASPMSIALSMPESDDTIEEDMLVDSDDEQQLATERISQVSLVFYDL